MGSGLLFAASLLLGVLPTIPFTPEEDRASVNALICPIMNRPVKDAEGAAKEGLGSEELQIAVENLLSDSSMLFEFYVVVVWIFAVVMSMLFSAMLPRWYLIFNMFVGLIVLSFIGRIWNLYPIPLWMPIFGTIGTLLLIYPISSFASRSTFYTGYWSRAVRFKPGASKDKAMDFSGSEVYILRAWSFISSLAVIAWIVYNISRV
ncbi:MAG: hypothetical protein CMJ40_00070 [Phycisphaerae bacterium]|nr:hypothetical protein [Phycisphaerae bacterium]